MEHIRVHHTGHRQSVIILKGKHRIARQLAEIAGDGDRRQLGIKISQKRQIILQRLHVHTAHADAQLARVTLFQLRERQPLAGDLAQPLDAGVDLLDLVPCRLADNAVRIEIKNRLERPDGVFRLQIVDAGVAVDRGDRRIILGNAVQLALDGEHIVAEGAAPQRGAGIGLGVAADLGVIDNADIVAVVVAQNLQRRVALIGEGDASPLRQAVAKGGVAVAELRIERLDPAGADDIVVKDLIRYAADVVVDLAAVDVVLVDGGIVGDVKIIAAAAVELRVDAVERKGDLRQNIGADGALRPGGIDLVGRDVFDVFGKRHRHIGRRRVGSAQMHGDRLRDNRCDRHIYASSLPPSGSSATGKMVSILSCTVTG